MHITSDQISNIEHKVAAIIGTGMVTYGQTKGDPTGLLTTLGGLLVAWAAVKSNAMNSNPPSNPLTK